MHVNVCNKNENFVEIVSNATSFNFDFSQYSIMTIEEFEILKKKREARNF